MSKKLETIAGYRVHPAATVFPLMTDAELTDLATNIKRNGLIHPVVVWGKRLVDGRNRLLACERSGCNPRVKVRDFADDDEAIDYVVSANLERRHLGTGQRAMVASRLKTLGRGGDRRSKDFKAGIPTLKKNADRLNVGRDSVMCADQVRAHGTPELVAAVDEGKLAVSTAASVAKLPKDEQQAAMAGGGQGVKAAAKRVDGQQKDDRRKQRIADFSTVVTAGRFNVILADPPWTYDQRASETRQVERHYPTDKLAEIKALPVADIAAEDCVLYLWATVPLLPEAMEVVDAWGFEYKTALAWVKDRIGMGWWARSRFELLLICTKGKPPTPEAQNRPDAVIEAPRREHSRKPDEAREIIEQMFPGAKRVELYAREKRDGWHTWGNEEVDWPESKSTS